MPRDSISQVLGWRGFGVSSATVAPAATKVRTRPVRDLQLFFASDQELFFFLGLYNSFDINLHFSRNLVVAF